MNPQSQHDPIAEHLRRDALAERPAFSADLHRQLIRGIRARSATRRRWIPLAAAAAIAAIGGAVGAVRWHASAPGPAKTNVSLIAGGGSPGSSPGSAKTGASALGYQGTPALPANFSVQIGGIATVQLSPMHVLIGPPPSADMPLHAVAEVATGSDLEGLVPPSLREIVGLAVQMDP